MIGGNEGPVNPDSLPDAFLASFLRSIGEPWAPQNAINFLRVRYTEHAYDPHGEDRFLGTLNPFAEDLFTNPITVPVDGRFSDAFENRYIQMLSHSLPAGSPRRMLMDSLAQNFRHIRSDLEVLAKENGTFHAARESVAHIQDVRLGSARDENEVLDLLTMTQGWGGHFEVRSRMLWAGLMNLLEPGRDVFIPADVSRLIRGVSNFTGIEAWVDYIHNTLDGTPLELDEQDSYAERTEAIRMWLDNFVGNMNWESTGHQAVRNSLYALLGGGRPETVRQFLEMERAGLGNNLWAAVHLAASNYRLVDDTLLSVFELARQDANSSLGYEMQEYLDASVALLSVPIVLAATGKYLTTINRKLADRASSQDHWLREPEGLTFLTDFYQRLLIQNGMQKIDGKLLRILAAQDINDVRARLIQDVLTLPEADRETNSKALRTLENPSFAEMLDTADPATFPFERYTGLISRRSLPPTTNGAAGANGTASGSTPPPPFAARSARASTVTGLVENTGETIGVNLGVAAPLYPATHHAALQRVHGAGHTQISGARAAIQARQARPVIATTVRPAQIVVP